MGSFSVCVAKNDVQFSKKLNKKKQMSAFWTTSFVLFMYFCNKISKKAAMFKGIWITYLLVTIATQ